MNILTESHISAIDTLFSYMVEKQMTYTGAWQDFLKGGIVFCGAMLGPINSLREMEDDFGVIPMAKKDEAQERYGNYVSNGWTTAYAVPMTNKDPDRIYTRSSLRILHRHSSFRALRRSLCR